ncbi:hypothetical protein FSST1_000558 [Fusarium sambucinum]
MKHVDRKDVKRLTNRNAILLLDLTSWTVAYIDHIISGSSKNIATKEGNKTLPAELWYEIFSWAEDDLRQHVRRLVYPVEMTSVQLDGKTTEPAVVCNIIDEWRRYGDIKNNSDLVHYENYLISPWYDPEQMEGQPPPPECPFFNISKTILPDQSFTIPIRELNVWRYFLFWRIKAPEVISWTEFGECKLCNPHRREFCAHCESGILEDFTSMDRYMVERGTAMFCPLCIGPEYATYSVFYQTLHQGPTDERSKEEYRGWQRARLKGLGYML